VVNDPSEGRLWDVMLRRVGRTLAADEVAVIDAGVKLGAVQRACVSRYVLRLASNFTARRNYPAPAKSRGRPPLYGERIRPLARTYRGREIPATSPDRTVTWQEEGRTLRADLWDDLVLPDTKPAANNDTFSVYAIYDPQYSKPWLLATPLPLSAAAVRAIYQDRWPVEQIPLSAKQILGAQRQFVHAAESIQRLPELALLAGSILSFLAATMPAQPTGFWDRHPRRTPGRFRRLLHGQDFPHSYPLPERIRKKASRTDHLPKGILGHRRKKRPIAAETTA
jgi:hypothetical protein